MNFHSIIDAIVKEMQLLHSESTETQTPAMLVNEMLDKLPAKIWQDKSKKFLDPACGRGIFGLCILQRLFDGLNEIIPDKQERLNHILKNQIYLADIDSSMCLKTKAAFQRIISAIGLVNQGINIYNDDSLEYKFDMKFDVIVGNPPYNEMSTSKHFNTKQKGSKNLTFDFFKVALSLIADDGYIAFVTPNHWYRKTNPIHKIFKSGCFIWAEIGQEIGNYFNVGTTITAWVWSQKLGEHNILCDGVKIDPFQKLVPLIKHANMSDWTFLASEQNSGRHSVKWTRADEISSMIVSCVVVERASPMKGTYLWDGATRPKGDWYFYNTNIKNANDILSYLKSQNGQRALYLIRSGLAMTHVINDLPVLK